MKFNPASKLSNSQQEGEWLVITVPRGGRVKGKEEHRIMLYVL